MEYSSNSSVRVTQNAVEAVLESYPGLVGSTSCSGRAAAHLYVTAQGRTGAGGNAGRATYASAVGRVGILGLDPVTNVRKIGGTGLSAASGQIRAAGFMSAATGGSSTLGNGCGRLQFQRSRDWPRAGFGRGDEVRDLCLCDGPNGARWRRPDRAERIRDAGRRRYIVPICRRDKQQGVLRIAPSSGLSQ